MKKIFFFAVTTSLAIIAHAAPLADLSASQNGRIEFNSITPLSMWSYARRNLTDTKQVVVFGDLLMPKNTTGKVPALILSHGSSGVSPYAYEVWARQMNAAGVAVFIVDSFKPRGISESAQDQSVLSPAANVADAMGCRWTTLRPSGRRIPLRLLFPCTCVRKIWNFFLKINDVTSSIFATCRPGDLL